MHGNTGKIHSEESKRKVSEKLKGRIWSEETRKKRSESLKKRKNTWGWKVSLAIKGKPQPWRQGEKCNFWRGGTTEINAKIRASLEYKQWRRAVFERDHYTCVKCEAKSIKNKRVILRADHIKPFAFYPELRFVVSNGRTLCDPCHRKTETFGKKTL
jgi:5-methylcytosine-specific restriction endonuclease McrA